MNEQREWIVDRTDWNAGPWDDEPEDKVEWRDEATGLPCLAVRSDVTGAWCGYVGIPRGNPLYGQPELELYKVLGNNVNFAKACSPDDGPVCHVPQEGESDDVWWAGFDCGHFNDRCPRIESLDRIYASHLDVNFPARDPNYVPYGSYKTVPYVRSVCADIAQAVVGAS